jgi:hypothetical protein
MFDVPLTTDLHRIIAFDWIKYWGAGGTVLIAAGLVALWFSESKKAGRVLVAAIIVFAAWSLIFASSYFVTDFDVFYYPLLSPCSILIAPGLAWVAWKLGSYHKILPTILALGIAASLAFSIYSRWQDIDVSDPLLNSAVSYASRALDALPQNALVIAKTDGTAFALMYAVNCGITDPSTGERKGPRPDVDVVVANWVKYDWFRENVQDRWGTSGRLRFISPSHDRDPALRILIDQNLEIRPVYVDQVTRSIIETGKYTYNAVEKGPLFWIPPQM